MRPLQRRTLFAGIVIGVVYGVVTFAVFRHANMLPALSFLVLVPAAMGAVPLLFADDDQVANYRASIFVPYTVIFSFLLSIQWFYGEGGVCIAIFTVPVAAFVMLGFFVVWLVRRRRLNLLKKKAGAAVVLMLFPFLSAPVERAYFMPPRTVVAESRTVIDASLETVWAHLAAVETIQPGEYGAGFFNWLGVPRPIRATIDHAALGGHRMGQFEYGLQFRELITAFDAPRRMTFSIEVDPKQLREGSMERHAFESGYFRFVNATYELESLGPDRTELRMSSTYVLKSGWNWYGNLWAHAVVTDFQDRVLDLLKRRCSSSQVVAISQ